MYDFFDYELGLQFMYCLAVYQTLYGILTCYAIFCFFTIAHLAIDHQH